MSSISVSVTTARSCEAELQRTAITPDPVLGRTFRRPLRTLWLAAHVQRSHLVRTPPLTRTIGAALSFAYPFPAVAGAMDSRGIAQALLMFFGVASLLLYLIVVCLVAVASRRPWRRAGIRLALWAFPTAAVAPTACLALLFGTGAYSQLDTALTWGFAFLVVASCALVVYVFVSSRRAGGQTQRQRRRETTP